MLVSFSLSSQKIKFYLLTVVFAELSEVLWNMVLQIGLKQTEYSGSVMLVVTFCFWALFTLAILVMMEGLSAFLHTLRLHW